jgi:hypothetical protein
MGTFLVVLLSQHSPLRLGALLWFGIRLMHVYRVAQFVYGNILHHTISLPFASITILRAFTNLGLLLFI